MHACLLSSKLILTAASGLPGTVEIIFRLILSLLLSGIIGIERELRNRPAGLRTYLLVGCGAALFMLTGLYVAELYPGSEPSRIAAQVVTGVGFLGAGTIITTQRSEVRGLTTAAGLWACAAIGITVGCGFYLAALIGTFLLLFSLLGFRKFDLHIRSRMREMRLYIEYNGDFQLKNLTAYAAARDITLSEPQHGMLQALNEQLGTLNIALELNGSARDHEKILADLKTLPGVVIVSEVY